MLLAGQVGPKAATTLTVLVSSALLGPQGRGQLAFVMATASLLSAFALFGLFIPAARSSSVVPRQYVDLLVALALLLDVALIALSVFAGNNQLTLTAAVFIAVNGTAQSLVVFAQHVLQARVSDREYFIFGAVIPSIVNLVVIMVLLLGGGVVAFLTAWSILNVLAALWAMIRLVRLVPFRRLRPYDSRGHVAAAAPFGVAFISSALATRGDLTVLGLVSDDDELGQYSLATSLAALLFLITQVFALRVASMHKSMAPAQYAGAVHRLARTAVLTVTALIPVVVLAGWIVVEFFLTEFRPALLPMAILCVAAVPETYARIHTYALGMTRRNRRLIAYATVSFVLFGLYFVAGRWGAIGMAVASVIGYTAQAFVLTHRLDLASVTAEPVIADDIDEDLL
jgi:O-antigen/teichoic acid export membrane protein